MGVIVIIVRVFFSGSDDVHAIDGELIVFEVNEVELVIPLHGRVLVFQLLHPQLQLLTPGHPLLKFLHAKQQLLFP